MFASAMGKKAWHSCKTSITSMPPTPLLLSSYLARRAHGTALTGMPRRAAALRISFRAFCARAARSAAFSSSLFYRRFAADLFVAVCVQVYRHPSLLHFAHVGLRARCCARAARMTRRAAHARGRCALLRSPRVCATICCALLRAACFYLLPRRAAPLPRGSTFCCAPRRRAISSLPHAPLSFSLFLTHLRMPALTSLLYLPHCTFSAFCYHCRTHCVLRFHALCYYLFAFPAHFYFAALRMRTFCVKQVFCRAFPFACCRTAQLIGRLPAYACCSRARAAHRHAITISITSSLSLYMPFCYACAFCAPHLPHAHFFAPLHAAHLHRTFLLFSFAVCCAAQQPTTTPSRRDARMATTAWRGDGAARALPRLPLSFSPHPPLNEKEKYEHAILLYAAARRQRASRLALCRARLWFLPRTQGRFRCARARHARARTICLPAPSQLPQARRRCWWRMRARARSSPPRAARYKQKLPPLSATKAFRAIATP